MSPQITFKFIKSCCTVGAITCCFVTAWSQPLEIKGQISVAHHNVNYGQVSEEGFLMDLDLDFKMSFAKNVSARFDLEFDNMVAGSSAGGSSERFDIGVDQAFIKFDDCFTKGLSFALGKQNFNVALRNDLSHAWAYGDPISVQSFYSHGPWEASLYYLKINEHTLGTPLKSSALVTAVESNDVDANIVGTMLKFNWAKDNYIRAYVNQKSDFAATAKFDNFFHYGLAADVFVYPSLEIYSELNQQQFNVDANAIGGSAEQFILGLEKTWSQWSLKPTLGAEVFYQSGSDPTNLGWQTVVGGMASGDTDSLFTEKNGSNGRDINPGVGFVDKGKNSIGYKVYRFNASLKPTEKTKVGLGLHLFSVEDSVDKLNAAFASRKMDTEYNVYAHWQYSPNIKLQAGSFYVTSINPQINSTGSLKDIYGLSLGSALRF
jgi:hypothetical protein